ncbi:MAG: xylose isomerase, partial [Planctomycetes bacterium]|nr:xylose isomerase [Planctomycetota bacterium]
MLGFCLNAFPCGSLTELRTACFTHAAAVRERYNALAGTPGATFSPGLWLGRAVAARLAAEPETLAAFAGDLQASGMAAATFNAF